MEQPIHDYVLTNLQAAKGNWQQVAIGSGVSRRTIEKIASREIEHPRINHIQALYDYFQSYEAA